MTTPNNSTTNEDLMSKCVTACQEKRWREAAQAGRQFIAQCKENGNDEFAKTFEEGALRKIDYSLKRQMAAALIRNSKTLLSKEYLIDVE